MTAFSSVSTAREAVRSGAFDYIPKPLDFEMLKATVERALNEFSNEDDGDWRDPSETDTSTVLFPQIEGNEYAGRGQPGNVDGYPC